MATEFPRFSELPVEIRHMIWERCLPHRFIELDTPLWLIEREPPVTVCKMEWATLITNKLPGITQVNRAAREVAMRNCAQNANDVRFSQEELSVLISGPGIAFPHRVFNYMFPGSWFDPARDSVVMYCPEPMWTTLPSRLEHRVSLWGPLAQEHIIHAPGFNSWAPRRREPADILDQGLQHGPLVPWQDPTFILQIVLIHTRFDEARASGLFGLAGDEPIQLVDPFDERLIQGFAELCQRSERPQAPSTRAFFNASRDAAVWAGEVRSWVQDGKMREVWRSWLRAWENNFAGIEKPEDIWVGPQVWNDRPLDRLSPLSYRLDLEDGIDLDQFRPNEEHPWVLEVLAGVPSFRPRLMFRLCGDVCTQVVPIMEAARAMTLAARQGQRAAV